MVEPVETETGTVKFDLTLSLTDTGQQVKGILGYSTDLFEEATIVRLLEHFQALLSKVVTAPENRLAEIPLLSPEERQQVLAEWSNAQAGPHLHDGIMEQTMSNLDQLSPEEVDSLLGTLLAGGK